MEVGTLLLVGTICGIVGFILGMIVELLSCDHQIKQKDAVIDKLTLERDTLREEKSNEEVVQIIEIKDDLTSKCESLKFGD